MSARPIASGIVRASEFDGLPDDTITLAATDRHRRRMVMTTDRGRKFLLDLAEAQLLLDGDILPLSDGTHVQVKAEPEPLLKVSARDSQHLLKLAWQVGNRHLAAQLQPDHILIRRDHVIEHMLAQLGAEIEEVEAVFNPEGGAYHGHSHD